MAAANRNHHPIISNTYSKGNKLVQPNFGFEKRQRELAKKKKKEEKKEERKQRKQEGSKQTPNENHDQLPGEGEVV